MNADQVRYSFHGSSIGTRGSSIGTRTRPPGETMKIALRVIAVLLVLIGVVWILQGINILPGSFMTGQMKWAVYGAIAVVVGIAIFIASGRTQTP
jgi:uncharacterized membrane protein HdeD (DUF308 family)